MESTFQQSKRYLVICWVLLMLATMQAVQANTCNPNIPLTRPNSRYTAVSGATPAGSEVLDNITGLVWRRCALGMVWNGTTCTGTASTYTWVQALEAARTSTASTATTGSPAVWRLPNYKELSSLYELACHHPAVNATWFPNTTGPWAITSSTDINYVSNMRVRGDYGGGSRWEKTNAGAVRLVRSSQ